jgi:Domain of unknown function (DUF1841)
MVSSGGIRSFEKVCSASASPAAYAVGSSLHVLRTLNLDGDRQATLALSSACGCCDVREGRTYGKSLGLDLVFGVAMSLQYDPDRHVDGDTWLEFEESERIEAVKVYHRRAKVRLPNEHLHAATHVIVENQVALGEAYPVQSVLLRLMEEGLGRHDAIHAIGLVLAERLFAGLKDEGQPTDLNTEYLEKLNRLTAESWRKKAG